MSRALVIQGTHHGVWLWTLWGAFDLRVLAQLPQHLHPVARLPRFDARHDEKRI